MHRASNSFALNCMNKVRDLHVSHQFCRASSFHQLLHANITGNEKSVARSFKQPCTDVAISWLNLTVKRPRAAGRSVYRSSSGQGDTTVEDYYMVLICSRNMFALSTTSKKPSACTRRSSRFRGKLNESFCYGARSRQNNDEACKITTAVAAIDYCSDMS